MGRSWTGRCYGGHIIIHEVGTLKASGPCVLFFHWWDLYGVAIILVSGRWNDLLVIRDYVGRILGWLK